MATDSAPNTLQEAIQYFSDEIRCIGAVARMRWPDGVPECPHCEQKGAYWLKTQKRWKCQRCRQQFSVKVKTIFEDSPISLTKWLPAMWLVANCKNGISSWEIHRALKVSQKSAWFMIHRIRLAMKSGITSKIGGPGFEVEADETFIGGAARNMHKARRVERFKGGRGSVTKTPVMGVYDRAEKRVHATVIRSTKAQIVHKVLMDSVERGTAVYTDSSQSYYQLADRDYVHQFVNHLERYVDGRVHTNGLENFWSLLKRGLNGTYVCVQPFHLFRYVDEQVFRFNNRATKENKLTDRDRFEMLLGNVAGKRLTYRELTGKDDLTTSPF